MNHVTVTFCFKSEESVMKGRLGLLMLLRLSIINSGRSDYGGVWRLCFNVDKSDCVCLAANLEKAITFVFVDCNKSCL